MQIIQPLLGTRLQPLGVRKPLGYSHRLLSRKESISVHGHGSTIKPLVNQVPLATYSQFLLSHENPAFSNPLIDANIPEPEYINADFPLIQFDTVDSVSENIQGDIPNILSEPENSKPNNITPELNIKAKSKPKKTEKSRSTRAKNKSQKNPNISATEQVNRQLDEITVVNNFNEIGLGSQDESAVLLANPENTQEHKIQPYPVVNNSINDRDFISITPLNSLEIPPIVDNGSVLFENFTSDENQVIHALGSTVTSTELTTIVHAVNIPEIITRSPHIIKDSVQILTAETNITNIDNLNNSEQPIVQEAPQAVDVSNILINPTSQPQEIANNPNIFRQEEALTLQQQEGLPHTSREIATELISNILPESNNPLAKTTLLSVEETPNLSHILANVSEVQSAVLSTEYSTIINALDVEDIPTLTTPEIISNVPIQLAPTPPVIANNPIELESAESVNFVEASANLASQQTDSTSNIPVELAPTSSVIADNPIELQSAESVNFVDVSANLTSRQTDSTSNVPVELAPTSPVIADKLIVSSETQSDESVNFVDASANLTPQQTESTNNVPVQLAPTSPVITDNLIVPSELQSAESVNLGDASESMVFSPDDSQANTDIPTVVKPPILAETKEVTQLDESAIALSFVTPPNFTTASSIFPEVATHEQPVEANLPSAVTNFIDQTPKEVEQNTVLNNLPAPQGFATGGQVTQSSVENPQIASSDTIPAMLTPGEFVVNANDAQKNLPILRHINTGGTPEDIILPSLEIPTPETPTKVDSFADISLQRQNSENHSSEESNSLIPSSLGTEISKHRLSSPSFLQLNTVENKATAKTEPSPHYSLPTLIFRKPSSNTNAGYETPTQWSSVEELLNGNNDPFTSFNFNSGESNWQNPEYSQVLQSSASPQIFTKPLTSPKGFANGGEVIAPDIARDIQPITETIQSPSAAVPEADESGNLEALAYEIYNRLRQRIEIERERQGIYFGRLPW
ncbi:MAG: hypothetical protein RMX68_021375 [Aulosira sp. ZfuVER01]|nr:hypothetical protein [Aulosira sp. ZfuVER01]MDZ8002677.1 hypothetical protein [Aulosira sp. DedVER01a]MDZ8050645.1 hypothetical protein [Aulosira sp. ZfuCHP01]